MISLTRAYKCRLVEYENETDAVLQTPSPLTSTICEAGDPNTTPAKIIIIIIDGLVVVLLEEVPAADDPKGDMQTHRTLKREIREYRFEWSGSSPETKT